MQKHQNFIDKYFENCLDTNEEEFLDYACEIMFLAYLTKSLRETKKKYIIKLVKQQEQENSLAELFQPIQNSWEDEYECYFEDIISGLTKKQQLYLKLSYYFGYTDKMIAKCMKVTPQAVYDLKVNAIRKLRREII